MTEEHYNYRINPLFLRNEFTGSGFLNMPTIPKPHFDEGELENLLLLGFDRAKAEDVIYQDRIVHFFSMTTNLNVFGKPQNWT